MRIASRIIGGLLILAGLGFAGLGILLIVIKAVGWLGALFPVAIGVGLLFAGRYYWRLDTDALEDEEPPPRPVSPFVAAHRRELSVAACAGLVLSFGRLIALCFGSDGPGWAHWALTIGCLALLALAPHAYKAIPKWATQTLTFWFFGLFLFAFLSLWHRSTLPSHLVGNNSEIFGAGFFAFLYALEALSFAYCVNVG